MPDFLKLAKERYSVRKFSNKKVEQAKLDIILEAGRIAPTAHNNQPQRILVLQDEEVLQKFRQCTPCHFNAPLVLVVCYDSAKEWVHQEETHIKAGTIDASIVATHMMLQAADIGIGTTWVQYYNHESLEEILCLPKGYVSVAVLPMGYPAESSRPSLLHNARRSIKKTVFYDTFKK